MIKTFLSLLILLMLINLRVYAQCNCSSSGSSCSFITNGLEDSNPSVKNDVSLISEFRVFKEGEGHDHEHSHEGSASHSHTQEISVKNILVSQLSYTNKIVPGIAININLPFLYSTTSSGEHPNSVGDLMLSGIVKPFKKIGFYTICGIKLPTGENLNLPNQNVSIMGTGSFDPFVGLRYKYALNNLNFNIQYFTKISTTGFNATNYGNFNTIQAYAGYVFPFKEADSSRVNLNKIAIYSGVNVEHYGMQRIKNVINGGSGGYALIVPVVLNYSFLNFETGFTFSVPVIQHYNGEQNKQLSRIKINFNYRF